MPQESFIFEFPDEKEFKLKSFQLNLEGFLSRFPKASQKQRRPMVVVEKGCLRLYETSDPEETDRPLFSIFSQNSQTDLSSDRRSIHIVEQVSANSHDVLQDHMCLRSCEEESAESCSWIVRTKLSSKTGNWVCTSAVFSKMSEAQL